MKRRDIIHRLGTAAILMLAGACTPDADYIAGPDNYQVTPLDITLELSEYGIKNDIDITQAEPSASLTIQKNSIFHETPVRIEALTQAELGSEYTTLDADQWSLSQETLTFAEDELQKSFTVYFHHLDRMEEDVKYALGLKLVSGKEEVRVNGEKGRILFVMARGAIGSIDNPFRITSTDDLKELRSLVNETEVGGRVYVELEADVDMTDVDDWEPLIAFEDQYRIFGFNGNGHVISNFRCTDKEHASFFGHFYGTLRDVTFTDPEVDTSGLGTGTTTAIVSAYMGDMPEHNTNILVENVHIRGGKVTGNRDGNGWNGYVGGLVAGARLSSGSIQVTDCSVEADLDGNGVAPFGMDVNHVSYRGCYFKGNVDAQWCAAGMAFTVWYCSFSDCYSDGSLKALGGGKVGGIGGEVGDGVSISCCLSRATIEGSSNVGGIVGMCGWSNGVTIDKCIAWNPVIKGSDSDTSSGRIIGWHNYANFNFTSCYARADMVCDWAEADPSQDQEDVIDRNYGYNRYNGKDATDVIDCARNTLKWDTTIWDFSDEYPKMAYE